MNARNVVAPAWSLTGSSSSSPSFIRSGAVVVRPPSSWREPGSTSSATGPTATDRRGRVKRLVYRLLRLPGDINAVRRGKVTRRVARRVYGKVTGRSARKLFG